MTPEKHETETQRLAMTDSTMVRTDPRLAPSAGVSEGEGVKCYAARTGKPASAPDPLALTPAFG
jgi:hypothetical protein